MEEQNNGEGEVIDSPGYKFSRVETWWPDCAKSHSHVTSNPMEMTKIILHIYANKNHCLGVVIYHPRLKVNEFLDSNWVEDDSSADHG